MDYFQAQITYSPEYAGDGYCALTFDLVDNYDGRQF
jgi:hypothetical protein